MSRKEYASWAWDDVRNRPGAGRMEIPEKKRAWNTPFAHSTRNDGHPQFDITVEYKGPSLREA